MKNLKIGYYIIASAIIWGAVIIGCSLALKGTGYYGRIQNILALGTIVHLLFIWGPIVSYFRKENPKK